MVCFSGRCAIGIHKIAVNVMNTDWDFSDDFQFTFHNPTWPLQSTGGESVQDIFDKSVINIDLPQMGSDVQNIMQGGEWRIYNSKFRPFTFSITFRDFEGLSLRSYYTNIWIQAQRGYFDEVKSKVEISIAGKMAFMSDNCLISNVSQVQLDNKSSQIVEFTVTFSSPYFTNNKIALFGSDGFTNKTLGQKV